MTSTSNDNTVSLQEEVILLRKRVNDLEAENARLTQQLAHVRTASIPPLWNTSSSKLSYNDNNISSSSSTTTNISSNIRSNLLTNSNGTRSAQTSPVRALRPQSSPAIGSGDLGLTSLPIGSSLPPFGSSIPPLIRTNSAPTTSSSLSTVIIPADHTLCDNCNKAIPTSSINMHKVHCARNISKCGHCGIPISIREIEKHIQQEKGTIDNLCIAINQGDYNTVLKMVQHGLSITSPCDNTNGDTPLHIASRNRRINIMEIFLSRGCSINSVNKSGETPLHVVCSSKDNLIDMTNSTIAPPDTLTDVVSFLLFRGCDVEAKTLLGDTPLQIAQRNKHIELLLLLSTNGGTLRPSSRDGENFNINTNSTSLPNSRPSSANGRRRLSSLHGGTNPDTLNLLQNVASTIRTSN